ncbi:MAG: D-2-hydroxyacid dehydrogenase [Thiothrix sp.]|nr:D-2-hydroxyacid dehydrogenase [Thiothrix sp.]HPQ95864.1 D-2-hydroxyacid dehydrogenase [Thiolinea sp.]
MNQRNQLLVLSPEADDYAARIGAAGLPGLQVHTAVSPQQVPVPARSANLLLGSPDLIAAWLEQAGRLDWVQSTAAGVNELCQPGLRRDYRLTNVRDVLGPSMSEYVFAYMLAVERRMMRLYQAQQEHVWLGSDHSGYRCLHELTLGVIGLGSIGRHIAATGAHFGMRVLGLRNHPQALEHVERVFGPDELEAFLPQPDYLVMVLPDTPATHGFMNAQRLALMKPEAVLINVGRGATVDEAALLQALRRRTLRAAVLDVFEHEPLPPDSPLWDLPEVLITPHNSARSFARQIVGIFIDNYRRFLSGQALKYRIDFERGY